MTPRSAPDLSHIAKDLRPLAVPISRLDEMVPNPRRGDVPAVMRSFERFGQRAALVVQRNGVRGTVRGGNHRLKAAKELGWTHVAVVWTEDDDDEAAAFALADNRTSDLATNDDAIVMAMLESLNDRPELFEATSYTLDDLALIRAQFEPEPAGLTDPDDVPDPPAKPVSKRGDVWLLGPHRVMCGDATLVEDYGQVLSGEHPVSSLVTDPPYGVAIGAKNRALDSIDRAGRVLTDLEGDRGIEEVEKLWRDSFGAFYQILPPGCPYYVFGPQGGDLGLLLLLLLRDSRLEPRHILIWVKNRPSFSIGRLDYDYQHEPIVYGWRPGASHHWHADGTRTSILNFDRPSVSPLHPTAKPVNLLAHLIGNSTTPQGIVLDPFAGSGSTLIACHQIGRRCALMEIDPHYVDVICRRYQEHTGEVPVLESTGKAHDFTA